MKSTKGFLAVKLIAFFLIFTFLILTLLTFFFLSSNLAQKYAQKYINHYIKNEIGVNLTFQSLKGNIYSNIKINNINCFKSSNDKTKIVSIKSAELNYNILKIIFKKNSILEAIDTIVLDNVNYFMIRDSDGKWQNIQQTTKKTRSNQKKINSKLFTKIFIKNSTIYYKDFKGWQKKSLEKPFETNITNFDGTIIFNGNTTGKIISSGKLKDSKNPISINGDINLKEKNFNIFTENIELDFKQWGHYAIPLNGYNSFNGNILFSCHLTNAKYNYSKKAPLWYVLKLNFQNNTLKTPYINKKLVNTTGNIIISKGFINIDTFKSLKYPLSSNHIRPILARLKEEKIISEKNILIDSTEEKRNNIIYSKKNRINNKVKKHINTPSVVIKLENINTRIENISTKIKGHINFKENWINIAINPNTFNSKKIKKFFTQVSPLNLENKINMNINVKGRINSPKLIGKATSKDLNCLFLNLKNVESNFEFFKNTFKFNIVKSRYNDGLLTNQTTISNISNTPKLIINTFISELNSKKLTSNKVATGNIDAICKLNGNNKILTGNIQILGKKASLLNQKLDSIHSTVEINNDSINFNKIKLLLNGLNTPQIITANIRNNTVYVQSTIKDLYINDPFTNSLSLDSLVNANAQFSFPLNYNSKNLMNFLLDTSGELTSKIKLPIFNNQTFKSFNLNMKIKDYMIFTSSNIINDQELITVSGNYSKKHISNLNITLKAISLNRIPALTNAIPAFLSLENGTSSSKIRLTNQANEENLTVSGLTELKNITFYNNKIDTLKLNFKASNNKITFMSIHSKFKKNNLNAKGYYDINSNELVLNNTKNSYFFIESIQHPLFSTAHINGKINLLNNTSISYIDNKFQFTSNIKAKNLSFKSSSISELNLNLTYQKNKFKIKTFKGEIDNGKFNVKGIIEKKDKNLFTLYISPEFNNLNINKIQTVWDTLSKSVIKTSPISESKISTFKIESPFLNKSDIILSNSEKNKESEINFINSILKKTQLNLKKTSIFKVFQGNLSGKLDIISNTNELPLIDGNIVIKDLSVPSFQSKSSSLTFNTSKELTNFRFIFDKSIFKESQIEKININGNYSKTLNLNLKSNKIITNKKEIKNILTGNLILPLIKTTNSHPINMNLNLNRSNITIIELINPNFKELSNNKDLTINISGSLEKPIFSTTTTSKPEIKLTHKETKFKIKTHHLSLKNNSLTFNNFNIHKQNTDSSYLFPFFNSTISGNISLQEFNMLNPQYIITKTNLYSKFSKTKLKTKFFDSDIEFKDTTISGNVLLGINQTDISKIYEINNLNYPVFKSDIRLENTSFSIAESKQTNMLPLNLDLNINIDKNVFFNSPIFGNNILGVNADLEFEETITPLKISGTTNDIAINNQVKIKNGSVTLLNKIFNIISPAKQQIFSSSDNQNILNNTIGIQTEFNAVSQPIITPKLSLKALCTIENAQTSTENTLISYTHVIMSIDDSVNSLKEIIFEIFESNIEQPTTISDLRFIKQFSIKNQTNSNFIASDQSNVNELLTILLPEIYSTTLSEDLLSSLGESQINSLVRQSILRPIEKTVAKQIGLNDIRINYNLGSKIIDNTEDTLGVQLIKNIISDKLVLRLLTNTSFTKDEEASSEGNFELSEIELSYYLLKNRNLSLNYNNYKSTSVSNKYLSKFSMRYDYEY